MKKILLAHDLSRRSSVALRRAVQLARQTGAALDVLHVIPDDLPTPVIDRRQSEAADVIRTDLSVAMRVAADAAVNVVVGRDYADILAWAETSGADLIVLAARREDALRPVVVGTTAERIIGFGTRPVLVVKNPPEGRYDRIAVAVDSLAPARRAAAFTFELQPDSDFRLVHVVPVTGVRSVGEASAMEKLESDFRALLPPQSARARLIVRHGSPIAEIRGAVKDFDADLLVVGLQRRFGLSRALIGAILENLLAAPVCDIMAVHSSDPPQRPLRSDRHQ